MPTTRNKNNESLPQVTIYTDGACTGNPGPGGWGVLLKFNGRQKVLSGGAPETTNNRMELTGAIEALKALNRPCRVQFYTDSEYVRKGITEWISAWMQLFSSTKSTGIGCAAMPVSAITNGWTNWPGMRSLNLEITLVRPPALVRIVDGLYEV